MLRLRNFPRLPCGGSAWRGSETIPGRARKNFLTGNIVDSRTLDRIDRMENLIGVCLALSDMLAETKVTVLDQETVHTVSTLLRDNHREMKAILHSLQAEI